MARKKVKGLTPKQRTVLKYLQDYIMENGVAPTYREILAFLGANSIGTVQRYIKTLEDKGYIEKTPGKHRYIEIKKPPITLEGSVSAGTGVIEEIRSPLDVMSIIKEDTPDFAVIVKGESMTAAGIKPGDFIFAKELDTHPTPGQIVIAFNRADGTYLIKRYKLIDGKPYLVSESLQREYDPIPVDENIKIVAIATGLYRKHL